MRRLGLVGVGLTLVPLAVACGAQSEEETDPWATAEPALVPTEADLTDQILTDPQLNPGVTSVLQPSYFGPATQAEVNATETYDNGATLNGTGDLTLLLVFDKSSSMLRDWDGKTRWQVANEALHGAIEMVLDELTIGAIRFPLGADCGVTPFGGEGQVGFMSGRAFVEQWRSMEHRLPSLGTPLQRALGAAEVAIAQAEAEGKLEHRFRVLLVTDGEPTCSDDMTAAISMVAGWHDRGVETVVFGLPGSSDASYILDALAAAGGTGQRTVITTHEQANGAFVDATTQ